MQDEEYLTIKEAARRTKFAEQTFYNGIHKKRFILGKHYYKPTSRKILFIWSALKEWIQGDSEAQRADAPEIIVEAPVAPKSKIRI